MAIVAPFMGITYNSRRFDEMAKLVAPPYDVISEEEQEAAISWMGKRMNSKS